MSVVLSFGAWMREGLRASILLRPRVLGERPGAWQLPALLVVLSIAEIALSRLEVQGPAVFDLRAWLGPWWATAAALLLGWVVLSRSEHGNVPAWLALWIAALVPVTVVSQILGVALSRDMLPWVLPGSWAVWAISIALWAWSIGIALRLAAQFGASGRGLAGLGAGLFGLILLSSFYFPDRPWQRDMTQARSPERQELVLSQDTFEAQQEAWSKTLQDLTPQRPGVVDVYGVVFAPFAQEDVFLRESSMVSKLLAERFDAQGRVLHLVNHPSTAESLPWATPQNLRRAVEALAEHMDLQEDVLVVYMTSHGANDFQLAAAHPPLEVESVSPRELREALDQAGVRYRVVAISACFSGGWIGPLASDSTLIMTAADEKSTSYGCGMKSELTFFGRAVFDEQLRKTHSLEQAFATAVPVIKQREEEARKPDGFSNPQISVGEKIRPVLKALEQRLGQLAPPRE